MNEVKIKNPSTPTNAMRICIKHLKDCADNIQKEFNENQVEFMVYCHEDGKLTISPKITKIEINGELKL